MDPPDPRTTGYLIDLIKFIRHIQKDSPKDFFS